MDPRYFYNTVCWCLFVAPPPTKATPNGLPSCLLKRLCIPASFLPTCFSFLHKCSQLGDILQSFFPGHRVGEEHVLLRAQNQEADRLSPELRAQRRHWVRAEQPGRLGLAGRTVIRQI